MEQSKRAFLNRQNEIKAAYNKLILRFSVIDNEIRELSKQQKMTETDIDAEKLLSGAEKGNFEEFELKISKLQRERQTVQKSINTINNNGGIESLLRTDKKLDELGSALLEDLKKVALEDEKKRQDLEKRYDKVIQQVLALDQEWIAFNQEAEQKKKLALNVVNNTSQKNVGLHRVYKMEKASVYYMLGQVKHALGIQVYEKASERSPETTIIV